MPAQTADDLQRYNETAGAILQRVIATLEAAGVRTCILHGYRALPTSVSSDVDCVVSADPSDVIRLLDYHQHSIGAQVVRRDGSYVVLATRAGDVPSFLCLDLMRDCVVEDLVLYAGDEVLASRRRFGRFWIPAAHVGFAAYFARSIYKGRLDHTRIQEIEHFYNQDPGAADAELTRFWRPETSKLLASAASRIDWERVRTHAGRLRRELISNCLRRAPLRLVLGRLRSITRRMSRLIRPTGVVVVLLGPDGAGKSSAIEVLGSVLKDAFVRQEVRGFAPALSRLWNGKPRSTAEPHGLPVRSFSLSLLRAGYWLVYNLWSHLSLHLARARSTLVLHDRHFSDILIDPRRYRYGGPRWALRLNTWLMPRPDLVVMLDAPAETLQARKQEVPFAETARQLALYREFVGGLSNGHIIDADRSREHVAVQAASVVLNWQAERCSRSTKPFDLVLRWPLSSLSTSSPPKNSQP
jgi:thymidylate kinase